MYVDANNNGTFDRRSADRRVNIALLDASGKSTGETAVTDSSGFYQFDNSMPGTYGISETQPAGYLDGLDTAGTVGGTAHNPGDLIDGIPLASGQSGLNYNFGELLPATVSGYVYVDANNNGTFDPGEAPIAAEGHAIDASGKSTGETAVTDSSGFYQFDNLMPGTYGISETNRPDTSTGSMRPAASAAQLTTPAIYRRHSARQRTVAAKVRLWRAVAANISGYVYRDDNNNGTFDPAKPRSPA